MATILVVDDDERLQELLRHFLTRSGFATLEATTGRQALDTLASHVVDLVVLDVMIPPPDGWQVCRSIKAFREIPVLMLTAKGETAEKLKGFELGADDYLVKPFVASELVARTKALLKRYKIEASQRLTLGHLTLDRINHQVTIDTQTQTLPPREFELLFLLAGAAGRTTSRAKLIEMVWGPDFFGNERTLDVHVNRLRKRFSEAASGCRITTVRGLGYRMEVIE